MSRKYPIVIALTALATVVIGLLALNLVSGEKRITRHVEHRYGPDDPQFVRVMGTLLGEKLKDRAAALFSSQL